MKINHSFQINSLLKKSFISNQFSLKNLSPVIVKNKTFWTPAAHVKVTFSLFLERISKKYESFECFLPGVMQIYHINH